VVLKRLMFIFPILILIGCAITKPEIQNPEIVDTKSILSTLKVRYDLVDSLSSWMNVGIESRGQKEEVRASLYYEKPDKLRVDARGPFNEPRAIFLATEGDFKIFFVAENEVIKGKLSDEVMKELFKIDLRISDVRSSIFANPFLDGNVDQLTLEKRGSGYLIRRPSTLPEYREEIYLSGDEEIVVNKWLVFDIKGNVIQDISFSKYQEVGGIVRPLKSVIHRPYEQTTISIESNSPEINTKLGDNTFSLPIPSSAKVYEFSELKDNQNSVKEN
jgi:outer membrane lipoprotein-sorting protein